MTSFLCVIIIVIAAFITAIVIYMGIRIKGIAQSVDDVKEMISGQADRLSQELFTDYTYINKQFKTCLSKIDSAQKSISLEIACLATKNNEDIKRSNGDFKQWDMFEYKKDVYVIYHIIHGNDGTVTYKCKSELGYITDFNKIEMACAKFLRTASPFEIKN